MNFSTLCWFTETHFLGENNCKEGLNQEAAIFRQGYNDPRKQIYTVCPLSGSTDAQDKRRCQGGEEGSDLETKLRKTVTMRVFEVAGKVVERQRAVGVCRGLHWSRLPTVLLSTSGQALCKAPDWELRRHQVEREREFGRSWKEFALAVELNQQYSTKEPTLKICKYSPDKTKMSCKILNQEYR